MKHKKSAYENRNSFPEKICFSYSKNFLVFLTEKMSRTGIRNEKKKKIEIQKQ